MAQFLAPPCRHVLLPCAGWWSRRRIGKPYCCRVERDYGFGLCVCEWSADCSRDSTNVRIETWRRVFRQIADARRRRRAQPAALDCSVQRQRTEPRDNCRRKDRTTGRRTSVVESSCSGCWSAVVEDAAVRHRAAAWHPYRAFIRRWTNGRSSSFLVATSSFPSVLPTLSLLAASRHDPLPPSAFRAYFLDGYGQTRP